VITEYFDVAQIALYAFWIFFAGLIFYLRREDKREGYPLDSDRARVPVQGWPAMPEPREPRAPHPALVDGVPPEAMASSADETGALHAETESPESKEL
jgi:hypothetical protein